MTSISDDAHVAALTALAEAGIEPDVQELLVAGSPGRAIAPGALAKALKAAFPATPHRRLLSELKECLNGVLGAETRDSERLDDGVRLIEKMRESYDLGADVPEGWQVVPKIATEAMRLAAHDDPLGAGEHAMTEANRVWLGDMYATMLAAAPSCESELQDRVSAPFDGRSVKRYVECLPIEWTQQANGYETTSPHPYYSATVWKPAGAAGWSYRVNGRGGRDELENREQAIAGAQEALRERLFERLQEAASLMATMSSQKTRSRMNSSDVVARLHHANEGLTAELELAIEQRNMTIREMDGQERRAGRAEAKVRELSILLDKVAPEKRLTSAIRADVWKECRAALAGFRSPTKMNGLEAFDELMKLPTFEEIAKMGADADAGK